MTSRFFFEIDSGATHQPEGDKVNVQVVPSNLGDSYTWVAKIEAGKTVSFNDVSMKQVIFTIKPEEEAKRVRFLKRNGVIPNSPSSDTNDHL